jgi:hypothetical protein
MRRYRRESAKSHVQISLERHEVGLIVLLFPKLADGSVIGSAPDILPYFGSDSIDLQH